MKLTPKTMLERCDTLMLDMDGTLLDLAFDNYMWLHHVPERYAEKHGLSPEEAKAKLYRRFRELRGKLEWYCLDHWSEYLGLDVVDLHRNENHRIAWLPGAEDFLRAVRERELRVLLVTNSHTETLIVKDEVTGVRQHFDRIYTSHEFGHPKEEQAFWQALREEEGFDPETTLFVDDNPDVLGSARRYGIRMLLSVARPDTTEPVRRTAEFDGVDSVAEMIDSPAAS